MVNPGWMESLVQVVQLVHLVKEAYLGCQVCQDLKAIGDSLVLMVLRATLESLVKKERKVVQDQWDLLGRWGRRDLEESVEEKARLVHRV